MATRAHPRVWSIPAGAPFLPTLADALLDGTLIPSPGGDPLALADVTVLLPTRRSVRAFRDVLADRLGGDAAILPVIRPIGDVDEEERLLDPLAETGADHLALPPPLPPLARRLTLTRLILAWATTLRSHPLRLTPDEPLRIPASAADAARLAGDLARLIDDVEIAGVAWSALTTLVPDDHAEYFQLTLQFLRIVTEQWPAILAELQREDPAKRRDRLIRAEAERIATHGSPGPIVAAGSTGSIPATAELLKAIAGDKNGAVVLPGLDQGLDEGGWEAIGGDDGAAATHGHPQYGLKQLIGELGIARADVALLGDDRAVAARTRLLSEAIRPAATLDAWARFAADRDAALAGVTAIVARNEHEEATAIALAIREAIERGEGTAALVTPERTLARRVAVELRRWGLAVDDSAGTPLAQSPHGIFVRLLAEAAAADGDPVALLALLKHPFAAFGLSRAACRQGARALELALFRGHRVAGGVAALAEALERARTERDEAEHVPAARRRLDGPQWALAADLASRLAACLGPLEQAIRARQEMPAATMAARVVDALNAAAADETGSVPPLWQGPGGEALSTLLSGLAADEAAASLTFDAADLPRFLTALMADVAVQPPAGADPRVHIWGTLEARLQSVDCLILGGLDEGVWPAETRTDPWLSRAMRAEIGLPPPERRLGLAAHDFLQGMAAPRVIVTRAEKRGGAPTVESRWLQRIRALIGKKASEALNARGADWLALARALDAPPPKPAPIPRPEPKPPLVARPAGLSITEIETLIRDPYAIYARRILKLEPLDPLGLAPDRALRGTLIHAALAEFTKTWAGPYDAPAEAALVETIGATLAKIERDFPDVHAVWAHRFAEVARWFIAWEASRDGDVAVRHPEIDGKLAVPVPGGVFTLRGRADRIDEMRDGSLAIYDFKSGAPQTQKTVFAGLTPQMTLEAAMARAGAFDGVAAGKSVSDLAWLAVGKAGRNEPYVPVAGKRAAPGANDDLADRAHAMLTELVSAFADAGRGYLSRSRPMMVNARYLGDYDHLARVREWSLVESENDVLGGGGGA